MIEVPTAVANKARAIGDGRWLDELPSIVAALERDWSISVGRTYEHGTEAVVVEALLDDGTPAVLKLTSPGTVSATRHEITALRLAGGEGCVRLLRDDIGRGALLLERLGRPLYELGLPLGAQHEILCVTAARVWRPAPDCGLPTGAEKAQWLADFITNTWEELGHPCSERAIDHAVECAGRRKAAHDDERAVLVHGDVHEWNALEAGHGFKLVDADGLLADPEYDMGIVMRENPLELMRGEPRDRSRRLAALTGLDERAIWEWGVVERVSTGLFGTQVGPKLGASQMLAAADRIAAAR